jgi:hypothetical protein
MLPFAKARVRAAIDNCGKQFNERSGGVLNRASLPSDVIAFVVFCRLRYRLTLRDLSEIMILVGEHDRQQPGGRGLGLVRRFADCFIDRRDPRYVEHQVETLVGQRIFGLALGYEGLQSTAYCPRSCDGEVDSSTTPVRDEQRHMAPRYRPATES